MSITEALQKLQLRCLFRRIIQMIVGRRTDMYNENQFSCVKQPTISVTKVPEKQLPGKSGLSRLVISVLLACTSVDYGVEVRQGHQWWEHRVAAAFLRAECTHAHTCMAVLLCIHLRTHIGVEQKNPLSPFSFFAFYFTLSCLPPLWCHVHSESVCLPYALEMPSHTEG